jgi:signal peptidase I
MRQIDKTRLLRRGLALILAVVIIEFGHATSGKFYAVDGTSMCPALFPNDVVRTKVSVETKRGDVAVVLDNRGDQAIKRIIGLPGETMAIFRGHVYVNGRRLFEPYLEIGVFTHKNDQQSERPAVWRLSADEYFVMGDNRFESCDSRQYGPLQRENIRGVIDLPSNSPKPSFLDITLSASGKVVYHKHYGPNRTRLPPRQSWLVGDRRS